MPTDEELEAFYQGFLYKEPKVEEVEKRIEERASDLVGLFGEKMHDGGAFLDYGGGVGMAALSAARMGMDVTLQDVDREALQWAESFAAEGVAFQVCETLPESNESAYDIIYVDNVIEHVPGPQKLLEKLYGYLAPGGQLLFKTPLARCTELYLYPRISLRKYVREIRKYNGPEAAASAVLFRPWTLDPPRHLYSFSPDSLRLLAEQVGVDRTSIGHYRLPLWEYSGVPKLAQLPRYSGAAVQWLKRASLAPIEIAGKLLNLALRTAQLTSPGGVILRVEREQTA